MSEPLVRPLGPPPPAASPSRVLLVDDDPAVRRDYARLLRSLGCTVQAAADGREAVEQLQGPGFDLIVSDISMPRLNGTELLRAVRERDLDVPVILMTGAPGVDTAVEAVEYGAFRYLIKPVPLDTLARAVHQAVHLHELARLKREALELIGAERMQLGDRASLDSRFTLALEKLWIAFQPIVQWPKRALFAYEALVRSDEPSLKSPVALLDAAERLGRLAELGRRIRALIARAAAGAPPEALLFVNVHATDLNDPELVDSRSPLSAIAPRVVLEVTERSSLERVERLDSKVARLRELGFRLAVDDLGAGYAGLACFSQLEPEFVKLDMSLVRGVDTSPRKRSIVRAMTRLCTRDLSIQLVSEGVETPRERDTLAAEGCVLLQGFLFARPERGFPAPQWEAKP